MCRWMIFLCVTVLTTVVTKAQVPEPCRTNVMICLDRSGSIWKDTQPQTDRYWRAMLDFLVDVCRELAKDEDESKLALVSFGNKARIEFTFDELTPMEIKQRIPNVEYNLRYGENTNLTGCLYVGLTQIFNEEIMFDPLAENFILVVTDGNATEDTVVPGWNQRLNDVADRVKARGIRIIGVGISQFTNVAQIMNIVTNPATDYVEVNNFEDLESRFATDIICPQPTTTTTTTTTGRPSTISIIDCSRCCPRTCSNQNPACAFDPVCPEACPRRTCPEPARPFLLDNGTCGGQDDCECLEDCRIDLILVVDESGSVSIDSTQNGGRDFWELDMRPFIYNLIESLNIGRGLTHVGLIMYNDDARVVWDLNEIFDKNEMLQAVNDIECKCKQGGNTNTADGLRLATDHFIQPRFGNREESSNVVVLITDGQDSPQYRSRLFFEADRLRSNARLLAVGVSSEVNQTRLEAIVTNPQTDYFAVGEFEELEFVLQDLIARTCRICPDTCPAPTPIGEVFAFSAYSRRPEFQTFAGQTIVFENVNTNIGGDYNILTGVYICPCRGLYLFIHECSGVDCEFGTVIVMDGSMISPIAYVTSHGAISTSAIHVCNEGQRVYVEIYIVAKNFISFNIDGRAGCGFKGAMLEPLA